MSGTMKHEGFPALGFISSYHLVYVQLIHGLLGAMCSQGGFSMGSCSALDGLPKPHGPGGESSLQQPGCRHLGPAQLTPALICPWFLGP